MREEPLMTKSIATETAGDITTVTTDSMNAADNWTISNYASIHADRIGIIIYITMIVMVTGNCEQSISMRPTPSLLLAAQLQFQKKSLLPQKRQQYTASTIYTSEVT